MRISRVTKILPFATATAVGIVVFSSLPFAIQVAAAICCVFGAMVSIGCAVKDLMMRKKSDAMTEKRQG